MKKQIWIAVAVGMIVAAGAPSLNAMDMKNMTPEQKAQMEQFMKFAAPGEKHKVLEPLIGDWDYAGKYWMIDEKSKPEQAKGEQENEWAFGGRFVECDFEVKEGFPMKAKGYVGYDNYTEQYNLVWLGEMGTGVMTGNGSYDASKKTVTFTGTFSSPSTGQKTQAFRNELKIISPDKHVMTMYMVGSDGKAVKHAEETYTRKKK